MNIGKKNPNTNLVKYMWTIIDNIVDPNKLLKQLYSNAYYQ
jgi:hypothetical protein